MDSKGFEEEWKLTSEVMWNGDFSASPKKTSIRKFKHCSDQVDYHVKNVAHPESEDLALSFAKKLSELELELKKEKAENKKMLRNHREQMRMRDKKEIIYVVVIACCMVFYACICLVVRGFV